MLIQNYLCSDLQKKHCVDIEINNIHAEQVKTTNLPGIIIDERLTWNERIEKHSLLRYREISSKPLLSL